MKTTRIGSWEFIEEPHALRYRLTATGLIPGALIFAFLSLTCILWARKVYTESSGGWSYLWCAVAMVCFGICLYGLFHHLRSYRNPYLLDRRTNLFSNGYKRIGRVSDISRVVVTRVEGVSDPDSNVKRPHYNVDFLLHNGEEQGTYITTSNRDLATQYARILRDFLQLPIS
jgi:hypothetical protein